MKKIEILEPGSKSAMSEFIKLVKEMNKIPRKSALNPDLPIKEQYHNTLDIDPRYMSPKPGSSVS